METISHYHQVISFERCIDSYNAPCFTTLALSDSLCETKTTLEHATQISSRMRTETSLSSCLDSASRTDPPATSILYCPQEQLCGFHIQPSLTGVVDGLNNITCTLFTTGEEQSCFEIDQALRENGN